MILFRAYRIQEGSNKLFIRFVNRYIVIYNNIFPSIILIYFYIINPMFVIRLTLKHFLQNKVVVFHRVITI
jgi:hypothetical protein